MKILFAATAVSVSALLGVAGAVPLLPSAHAEEGEHNHSSVHAEKSVQAHQTLGIVKSIDGEKGRVKLAHDPIPTLGWPGMSMWFAVADKAMLGSLKPGQKIKFTIVEAEDGKFVVTEITTP